MSYSDNHGRLCIFDYEPLKKCRKGQTKAGSLIRPNKSRKATKDVQVLSVAYRIKIKPIWWPHKRHKWRFDFNWWNSVKLMKSSKHCSKAYRRTLEASSSRIEDQSMITKTWSSIGVQEETTKSYSIGGNTIYRSQKD